MALKLVIIQIRKERRWKWGYLLIPFIVTGIFSACMVGAVILLIIIGILTLFGYGEHED